MKTPQKLARKNLRNKKKNKPTNEETNDKQNPAKQTGKREKMRNSRVELNYQYIHILFKTIVKATVQINESLAK